MIGRLSGTCVMSGSGEAIIDVGGVGYLVQCGGRTLSELQVGEAAILHIETHVREQAITLYGFASEDERAWFVRLQAVQGVGPKAALAILDTLSPSDVLSAAALGDKDAFARASGVGPKLAARIATELSGKPPPMGRGLGGGLNGVSAAGEAASHSAGDISTQSLGDTARRNDAVSALVNLGISQSDALRAVARAARRFDAEPETEVMIKSALKELGS